MYLDDLAPAPMVGFGTQIFYRGLLGRCRETTLLRIFCTIIKLPRSQLMRRIISDRYLISLLHNLER
jgi:hypothetical protein